MKQILSFTIVILLLLVGCEKEGARRPSNYTKIYVKAQGSLNTTRGAQQPGEMSYEDSVSMIVKYAGVFNSIDDNPDPQFYGQVLSRGIGSEERDILSNRFVWFGEDCIVANHGVPIILGYRLAFLNDIVICAFIDKETGYWYEKGVDDIPNELWTNPDTVAYIPNAMVRQARIDIQKAFDKEDWDECYRLFDEAYKFIPITAERWKELKARGEN